MPARGEQVKYPAIPLLKEKTYDEVSNWIHLVKGMKARNVSFEITAFISGKIARLLAGLQVSMDYNSVIKFFDDFLESEERQRSENFLATLRKELVYPPVEGDAQRSSRLFFEKARNIVELGRQAKAKEHNKPNYQFEPDIVKRIARIVIRRLPKDFKFTPKTLDEYPSYTDLKVLEEKVIERSFVLDKADSDDDELAVNAVSFGRPKELNLDQRLASLETSIGSIQQAILRLSSAPTNTQQVPPLVSAPQAHTGQGVASQGQKKQYKIVVRAVSVDGTQTPSAAPATVEVFDPKTGLYEPVKGMLDSGASASVGSVRLHGRFANTGLHEPKKPAVITFADGVTTYPVTKVGWINLKVSVPNGEPRFVPHSLVHFVDAPKWDTLLLGRKILKGLKTLPEQNLQ